MNLIYKYMELKYLKDAILHGIYASKIKEVNDPYEFEGIKNNERFRICTMTKSSKSMLMWAHYGDRHRGCCVGFKIEEEFNNYVKKINYVKELINHRYLSEENLKGNLFRKGNEWEYENEWRAVYYLKSKEKIFSLVEKDKVFLPLKVKKIIFGCLSEYHKEYKRCLKFIKKYDNSNDIDVKKLIPSDKKYELIYDLQYNYLDEI